MRRNTRITSVAEHLLVVGEGLASSSSLCSDILRMLRSFLLAEFACGDVIIVYMQFIKNAEGTDAENSCERRC